MQNSMPDPQDLESVRNIVRSVYPLDEEAWTMFSRGWEKVTVPRKEILTPAGEQERYLYFVLRGVQRAYAVDESGADTTFLFTYPPSFGGMLTSVLQRKESRYYYETLTASELLRLPVHLLHEYMQVSPAISSLIRIGVTDALAGVLDRLVEIQSFSAEAKFRSLLRRSPHLLQLVPHKYIASYIGIDPTNFSKLIHSVRI